MKLHTKINSERGKEVSKSGNEYIEVELYVNDRKNPVGYIVLDYMDDKKDGYDQDEWLLKFSRSKDFFDCDIIAQGHTS